MKILGIDPGTATTGYGVLNWDKNSTYSLYKFGWIETNKDSCPAERLGLIYHELVSILKQSKPNVLVMEKVFFFANAKTVIRVSQAQGVILLAAQHCKVPVHELAPLEVKKIITGNGWAKKEEIKKAVKSLLRIRTPKKKKTHFDDVADALAIAICYIKKSEGGES